MCKFLLDADVFIQAKNGPYAFDIAPGFWQGLQDAVASKIGNSGFVVGRFPPSRAVCDNFGDARP
jgi:hypothetical protein